MTADKEERLLQRLLLTFKGEAGERIGAIVAASADLDSSTGAAREQLVEAVFRDAHSLKAAARSVGQKEIELLCQAIESVFAALKRGECALPPLLVTQLRAAAYAMEDALATIGTAPSPARMARAIELAKALERALEQARSMTGESASQPLPALDREQEKAEPSPDPPSPEHSVLAPPPPAAMPEPRRAEPTPGAETVRLSVHRLEHLLRESEEMLSEKLAARQVAVLLNETIASFAEWQREWGKVQRAVSRLLTDTGSAPHAASLGQFFAWNERHMIGVEARLANVAKAADGEAHRLGLKVDRLLRDVKEALTLPCSSLLELLPRTVRELAREQAKEVELSIEGGDLEIDRRILQELRDPLLHLVRNCVDHGIEKPGQRKKIGKPARATITIRVMSKDGDKVEFVIADDGAGVATGKLAAAATKLGLLSAGQMELDEPDLLQLIFESGVSTSPVITDVSGRGLGLAIVRERVERLGGSISVDSQAGKGTVFRLVVPLSLATYHGISVRVAEQVYVFPTLAVAQVVGVQRSAVSTVESRLMLDIGGAPVPLVRLHELLELPPAQASSPGERVEAVIVGAAGRQVAFEVDSVLGDQEILLKPLGKCLVRVRNVQGGTILASGEIAPILNVGDLVKSAARLASSAGAAERGHREAPVSQGTILVVEDSITARSLLRSILESAGYRVTTAADGVEAWATLNLESFDLVVSDVEMPRMNGFDLTARIRSHRTLADLPVVLVTALESRDDRERGADVGANAYILKGGFEQGILLEAVKRLI